MRRALWKEVDTEAQAAGWRMATVTPRIPRLTPNAQPLVPPLTSCQKVAMTAAKESPQASDIFSFCKVPSKGTGRRGGWTHILAYFITAAA